jgi:NAD(P)-dependent dehydrogenase (short-subunit alcohol dehydrogenase family)
MRLENQVAVVTGAASGIGKAAAQLFAKEGARVAVVDLDRHGGEETVRTITAEGGQAIFVQVDVTKSQMIEDAVSRIVSEFGKIDVLYNCAGVEIFVLFPKADGTVVGTREIEWDTLLDINLKGTFLFCKYVIPHMMKRKRGVVLNMGSDMGIVGGLASAAYCASKGGVVLMTKQMALDYAPFNIRVNCICQTNAETPLNDKGMAVTGDPEGTRKLLFKLIPLGRFATSQEIAKAALYLASDDGCFVTGATFTIDGGVTAGGTATYLRRP